MESFLIRLPRRLEDPADTIGRPRKVNFQDPLPARQRAELSLVEIPQKEDFIKEWPEPPTIPVANAAKSDTFPLFWPSNARYFNEKDHGYSHRDHEEEPQPDLPTLACANEDAHEHSHASFLIDKHYVYTGDGTIKDLFFYFRATFQQYEGDSGRSLADQINQQLLQTMTSKEDDSALGTEANGEPEGWDEDDHSPLYWSYRMREVDFFVKNDLWSVDPIGDWSYLNAHAVPKHFLRKIRRYFEMRPLEFLRDTGSYRLFHIINQYNDLARMMDASRGHFAKTGQWLRNWTVGCLEKLAPLEKAGRIELDHQVMVWLSLWDARLKANVFQLKEISMSDWFFTWVDWKGAIGVQNLLTKNEQHAFDDFWEHNVDKKMDADEEGDEGSEDLENWMAGEEDDDEDLSEIQGAAEGIPA